MTGLPARRLGWTDRGLIKPGYWADVVLLKPTEVRDEATFQAPHRYAVGVEHVLVHGEWVLKSGRMTGQRPGRPIFSVPVAETPWTRLRRELLELLGRHDGRYGLYAEMSGGQPALAINADDPFRVDQFAEVSLPTPTMSLRELTRRLIAADQKGLVVRPRADDKQRQYLMFERIALP